MLRIVFQNFIVFVCKMLNGIEAQMAVVSAGGPVWKAIRNWAMENRLLTEKELGILSALTDLTRSLPTERQCVAAIRIAGKLRDEGCPLVKDIP